MSSREKNGCTAIQDRPNRIAVRYGSDLGPVRGIASDEAVNGYAVHGGAMVEGSPVTPAWYQGSFASLFGAERAVADVQCLQSAR
jgi:hypothetical protein